MYSVRLPTLESNTDTYLSIIVNIYVSKELYTRAHDRFYVIIATW